MFIHSNIITPIEFTSTDTPTGRFYVTPTGDRYPSITTVLGSKDKPWLNDWRESIGPKQADKETKRASDRGTAVHLMLERQLQNDLNITRDQEPTHIAEFNSLRLYMKKLNNIVLQEAALYSDILKVAGRVDCIAEYNGVLSVVDFKTATRDKNPEMIQDYYKQASFYALAFQEMYDIQIDNIVILMSVERGFPLIFHERVENWIEPLVSTVNTYHNKKQ